MQAVPIQMSAAIQITARTGIGTSKLATTAPWGIHHANRLVRGLRSQSFECLTLSLATITQSAQQEASVSPERSACIGGHGTEPSEQNTQHSPGFGRSIEPQPVHL